MISRHVADLGELLSRQTHVSDPRRGDTFRQMEWTEVDNSLTACIGRNGPHNDHALPLKSAASAYSGSDSSLAPCNVDFGPDSKPTAKQRDSEKDVGRPGRHQHSCVTTLQLMETCLTWHTLEDSNLDRTSRLTLEHNEDNAIISQSPRLTIYPRPTSRSLSLRCVSNLSSLMSIASL